MDGHPAARKGDGQNPAYRPAHHRLGRQSALVTLDITATWPGSDDQTRNAVDYVLAGVTIVP